VPLRRAIHFERGGRSAFGRTLAARLVGLHRGSLQRWMKRGRKGENGVLCHFYVTVQEALAKSEQKLVELVFNHAGMDWRAAA
jgi:hypothetical protein